MTTERLAVRAPRAGAIWAALPQLCGAGALLVLSCAHGTQTRHGDRLDVSSYPPQIQRDYAVFARRCSRCHTLARPLNAHIRDPQHWVRYVTRMRRNPSSGINKQDAALILNFLLFYTAEVEKAEQVADEPPELDPEQSPVTPPTAHESVAPNADAPVPAPAPQPREDGAGAPPSTAPDDDPSTEPGATPAAAPPSEDALP
jgi:hypothetical protein